MCLCRQSPVYLHEEIPSAIEQRDIKASNLLIDQIYTPTLAKTTLDEDKLLLEKAWELYEVGKLEEMVDPAAGSCPQEEAIRYLKVAFLCR